MINNNEKKYKLIKFEDGEFSLDVNVSPDEDTVWINVHDLAKLFERDEKTIRKHINNILNEECDNSAVAFFATTALDGKTYNVAYYNLDVIISLGYRVKSNRGILFRKWANTVLKQYLLNGAVISEERCLSCASNIISLQNKIEKIESRIKDIEDDIYAINSKIFYEGEIVEAYTFIRHIFFLAKKELIITDYYADNYLISMLKDLTVKIKIITSPNSYLNKIVIPNNISIVFDNDLHGRYIFIDDKFVYAIDNSFNNIGKKKSIVMRLENITKEMLLKDII